VWIGSVVIASVLALTGCTEKPQAPAIGDDVLAVVDGVPITVDDLRDPASGRRGVDLGDPTQRKRLLEELIDYRAIVARAREEGYEDDPVVVRIVERALVGRYTDDERARRKPIEPTDAEVEAFWKEHPELFGMRERVRIALIVVHVPESASAEERADRLERADEALEEARRLDPSVRHFGDVAANYSDDTARRLRGGEIGWLVRGVKTQWSDAVIERAFALERPGDLSEVFETRRGFAIAKLVDREGAGTRPLDSRLRPAVVRSMRAANDAAVSEAFRKRIRTGSRITRFDARLDEIDFTAPKEPTGGDAGASPDASEKTGEARGSASEADVVVPPGLEKRDG